MRPVTISETGVLRWSGRVLTAIELERVREPVREIRIPPRTIITPSAADWIRATGAVVTEETPEPVAAVGGWCCSSEKPFLPVETALAGLSRDGISFAAWPTGNGEPLAQWVRWLAEHLAAGECAGAVAFCQDAALAVCVANKVATIRAAAVANGNQVKVAFQSFAANWLAVTVPGPTFFEIRQILRTIATTPKPECPPNAAEILAELEQRG
jgi:hypothetical protein